jgi:hypothetical protein
MSNGLLDPEEVAGSVQRDLAPRIFHTQGRNIGLITASLAERTPAENASRNWDLLINLLQAGSGVFKVYIKFLASPDADDVDTEEVHACFVLGKSGDDSGHLLGNLRKLGRKYEQYAALLKRHDSGDICQIDIQEDTPRGAKTFVSLGVFNPERMGEYYCCLVNQAAKPVEYARIMTYKTFSSRKAYQVLID